MQQEINISIGQKSPDVYFRDIREQCSGGKQRYGGIDTLSELNEKLKTQCISENIFDMNVMHFDDFLKERRGLIAEKIKGFYQKL
jgi:hypothetical protein